MEACARGWSLRHSDVAISWEARPLADFGDQPLEEVASRYDLLLIDHPFCGAAEVAGVLRPLDELLTPEELVALAADAVGPSHDSYAFNGHQWALAIDAACQVSAVSPTSSTKDRSRRCGTRRLHSLASFLHGLPSRWPRLMRSRAS